MELSIDKSMLKNKGDWMMVDISIDGDVIASMYLANTGDGTLEYAIGDQADLDGAFTIHNTCPEYFEGGE